MGQINVAVPYRSKIILHWINSIKATTKVRLGLGMGPRLKGLLPGLMRHTVKD